MRDPLLVAAHRGDSSVAPENTLAAIAAAASAGADLIELDVAPSADGVPFVLHDATVDRTTDGAGPLRELPAAALDRLDAGGWFGPAFAGEPLPRLDAALAAVRDGRSGLLLELKGRQSPAQVARAVAAVRAHGMLGRTLLQSFEPDVLRAARAAAPTLRLALLRHELDPAPAAAARAVDACAYHPSWAALREAPSAVAELHAAGLAVMPWTVDDPREWAAARAAGVDGIITNRPGALAAWRARRGAAPAPTPVPAFAGRVTVAPAAGTPVA